MIIDLVNVTPTRREVRWSVKWESLNRMKFWSALVPVGKETILNMIGVINQIRHGFDEHANEERTSATTRLEVPTTWHELDDFFIQQLFGHTRVLSSNFGPQKWLRSTTE